MKDLTLSLRKTAVLLSLSLLLVLGLVLVACGGDEDDDDDRAEPTRTATAAATATGTATAAATATETATAAATPTQTATPTEAPRPVAPGYPRDVVDLFGRTVTIPDKPRAIVAISPTAAELVYAVGGSIIGRSASVDFPPEAQSAPSVGTAYQPNFEAILALGPDLVVADSTIHIQPAVREALEALNVPVVFAGAASVDEVITGLALLGEALDNAEAAAAVVAEVEAAREAAREALAGLDASAVILIGDRDRQLYGAKGSSYGGSILAAVGIVNPASDQPDSGPFPGFTRIAPEALLQFNPLYVFTVSPAPPPAPTLSSTLGLLPGLNALEALTNGRVIELDVQLFVQAPGPRVIEAFAAIVAAVSGQ